MKTIAILFFLSMFLSAFPALGQATSDQLIVKLAQIDKLHENGVLTAEERAESRKIAIFTFATAPDPAASHAATSNPRVRDTGWELHQVPGSGTRNRSVNRVVTLTVPEGYRIIKDTVQWWNATGWGKWVSEPEFENDGRTVKRTWNQGKHDMNEGIGIRCKYKPIYSADGEYEIPYEDLPLKLK